MPPKKKSKTEDMETWSGKELKTKCKECGISQTGEKGTLIWRLKLFQRNAKLDDGRSPFELKTGELKKIAASFGVSPMGTNDELLDGIIKKLDKTTTKALTPVDIAKRVLELFEADDYLGILNLGASEPLTSDTSTLQKCYRRLSLVLHPDKLRNFDRATQAFQAVVTALERLTEPTISDEPKTKKRTIARSNENCVRTRIRCPRCKEPWGERNDEGLPDWSYNLMMMGLRNYTCSTCLCEFGCVSALHEYKGTSFDYAPEMYHSEVTVSNKKFGFYQYHMSDRALNDAIADAKQLMETNAKRRAAKKRRAAAVEARGGDFDDEENEARFLLGLIDECPRCGTFFGAGTNGEDRRNHLDECTDAKVHKKYKQKKMDEKRTELAKEAKEDEQSDVQAKAAWDALGSTVETMWMLPSSALAKIAGTDDAEMDREDLLVKAASKHRNGQLLLTDGSDETSVVPFSAASLPQNYSSLPVDALRAVCAAHGVTFPSNTSKRAILRHIDAHLDAAGSTDDLQLLLAANEDD